MVMVRKTSDHAKKQLPQLEKKVQEQADRVRALKASGAHKDELGSAVTALLSLQTQLPENHPLYPVTKVTTPHRQHSTLTHCPQAAKKKTKKEDKKAHQHYVAGENPCQWPQVPHYPRQIASSVNRFISTAELAVALIQVKLIAHRPPPTHPWASLCSR